MVLDFEASTLWPKLQPGSMPVLSYTAKEDTQSSLMKHEDGMPIRDLATSLEYYTKDICFQENCVLGSESRTQHLVEEMHRIAAANTCGLRFRVCRELCTAQDKLQD
jgi:hypothetical protein